jgi:hypothetical protein
VLADTFRDHLLRRVETTGPSSLDPRVEFIGINGYVLNPDALSLSRFLIRHDDTPSCASGWATPPELRRYQTFTATTVAYGSLPVTPQCKATIAGSCRRWRSYGLGDDFHAV